MKHLISTAVIMAAFVITAPASAEVKSASETGFNIIHVATVDATPDDIWKRLIAPKEYWSKAHSWSGSTDGFYIDAQANGCFCELFQEVDANGKLKTAGSVEHMRVIFAQPGKVLRMQGALGPLQSEAVLGTLTVAMEPVTGTTTTRVSFSYVVGGYMRYKVSEIAPAVDKVLGEQFRNMLSPFTPVATETPKADDFTLDVEKVTGSSDGETPPTDVSPKNDSVDETQVNEMPPPEPK